MEPLLDESSLVPCSSASPSARIGRLAETLKSLDEIGAKRVLRCVRDAPDRDLGDGRGLRAWCFDRRTPRDAGRLIATRLDRPPYIDGEGGLFSTEEGQGAAEACVAGQQVFGLGLAALVDGIVVALTTDTRATGGRLIVDLVSLDEKGQREERVEVETFTSANEVAQARNRLLDCIDRAVPNGADLIERLARLLPRLRLGEAARTAIRQLTGSETVFRQVVRHLRALDEGARMWSSGPYEPVGVSYSVESDATLNHGTYGPQREFPAPKGFVIQGRWSLHTKLTGGNGARIYFAPVRDQGEAVVLVGYFGPHLDTVRHH